MDDLLVLSSGDPVSYFEALKARGRKNIVFSGGGYAGR